MRGHPQYVNPSTYLHTHYVLAPNTRHINRQWPRAPQHPHNTHQRPKYVREIRRKDLIIVGKRYRVEGILELVQILRVDDPLLALHGRPHHLRTPLVRPGSSDAADGPLDDRISIMQLKLHVRRQTIHGQ